MVERKVRILVADDQSIFRNGLVTLLNTFQNMEVIGDFENGQLLFDALKNLETDVVLLDQRMPVLGGMETAQLIHTTYPKLKILILSMYDQEEFVVSAIENGAHGYLSKDDDSTEIEKAIRCVMEMGYYMNDRTSKVLVGRLMLQGKVEPNINSTEILLTDQELEVIQHICNEKTTQEISDKIFKSIRTVENIRTNIMQKIGARNVVGIVMYAVKNNLV
jgi:two-component system, NarL family, response regulator NreC